MIGEAPLEPEAFWLVALTASGLAGLAYLVWRQATGRPLLRSDPTRFQSADTSGFVLLALALFFGYQLCGTFIIVPERYTPWGAALATAGGLLIAWLFHRYAVGRVMAPRGTVAARIGLGLLVLWAALPVVYGCLQLMNLLMPEIGEQAQIVYMRGRGRGWEAMAIFAAVVAPLAEEIGFRGLLYPAVRRLTGPGFATAFTAVLFGAIHEQLNVKLPLAVLGVFLALLVEFTGSILPSIVAHMGFNSLTVALLLLS